MNDKEMQTVESTKVTAVQCSMLNVSHLQEICNEIDAQIVSVRNRARDRIVSRFSNFGVLINTCAHEYIKMAMLLNSDYLIK